MTRYLVTAFAILAIASAVVADESDPDLPRLLAKQGFTTVNMARSSAGHFEVFVQLDGRNMRLLVDTGSDTTVFDVSLMKKLNYRLQEAMVGHGLGGTLEAKTAVIQNLRIGNCNMGPTIVHCFTLEHVNQPRRDHNLPTVDGILGMDLLTKHGAIIDVARSVLLLRNQ